MVSRYILLICEEGRDSFNCRNHISRYAGGSRVQLCGGTFHNNNAFLILELTTFPSKCQALLALRAREEWGIEGGRVAPEERKKGTDEKEVDLGWVGGG